MCSSFINDRLGIQVQIVLGRPLLSNILTVYLPTILLNIIGYTTNFFKAFFFEAVISVNLTVMLVLATMSVVGLKKYLKIILYFSKGSSALQEACQQPPM